MQSRSKPSFKTKVQNMTLIDKKRLEERLLAPNPTDVQKDAKVQDLKA